MEREITCSELIKQIDDGIQKQMNHDLKKCDLTFSQMSLLTLLYAEESRSLTMKEIEKNLRVAQPTVTGIIKRLKEKEFIRISSKKGDGRIKIVTLTEKGEECCKASENDVQAMEEKLISGFSHGERKMLFTMLCILRDALK